MMLRSQFRKTLQDGLNTVFGLEYDKWGAEWSEIFPVNTSKKAYEEDVLMVGLGGAVIKPEGAPVTYDEGHEAWVARYTFDVIALAFSITEEAVEDNLYLDLGSKYSKMLAKSLQYTKEIRCINVFNYGFSNNPDFLGGDGKPLFASDHPLTHGGTLSNILSTSADLSEESLEDAITQIEGFVDDRGIPIKVMVDKLVIPRQLRWIASRILKTEGRVGTNLNDRNELKSQNAIPGGMTVNHYLQDPDAWYLTTSVTKDGDGLKYFQRRKVKGGVEGDFETGNMRYKKSERFGVGFTNWRGSFASAG